MRLSYRLILSLVLAITVVSVAFALYQVQAENRSRRNELERRAQILAESLQETVEPMLARGAHDDLQRLVERFGNRERLAGVAIYDRQRHPILMTSILAPRSLSTVPVVVDKAVFQGVSGGDFFKLDSSPMHVYAVPLHHSPELAGALAVFHDATYIETQNAEIWRHTFVRVLIQMLLISGITLLIVRWTMLRPIARMTKWLNDMRAGTSTAQSEPPMEDVFKPLTREINHLAASLKVARASAEEEARLREASDSLWTAERLRVYLQGTLGDSRLFVVSNREPYEHVYRGNEVATVVPASGLVTAMEPILRACDGTWVAHGAGDADRETVDSYDRLHVPPEQPQYTLRRVWLTKEEEQGYYYGFANEGLWPLCHIAHTRPIFRVEDWECYREVNEKFAEALLEEMEGEERPIVLAQDYHFALLPRLIKEKRPDVRVAIFWHIPWPNPEAFAICPWQRQLVDGLLGADLIGFHTQSHCNNFLQTVDRTIESRIQWERLTVNRGRHLTAVRPFPISVDFKDPVARSAPRDSIYLERVAILKQLGVEGDILGIGVDRLDYTKGIPERFCGIERFLEKHPSYVGRFTFVQIGAPTRTHIKRYKDLIAEVEAEAERINWRFQTSHWKPIVFLKRHHSHQEIEPYYRVADFCLVTSLHDGMNLVAKEFVASRDDDGGALILSGFTGASEELRDALIINPYDTEQLAEAIRFSLEMDPRERTKRMRAMRRVVKEHNIYRWAANLTGAVSEIRLAAPEETKIPVVLRERPSPTPISPRENRERSDRYGTALVNTPSESSDAASL